MLPPLLASIGWRVIDRFHIGGSFAISPHGIGIAIGFLSGAYLFLNREAPRRGIPDDVASSAIFWALIGTLIGSRLGYVVTHLSQFHDPIDILRVYRGGLSQLGGVVGAILCGYVVIRRHRAPFLPALDAAAIGIPLGVVIGRVGDLIIGDHLGKPTSWLLAWRYEGGQLSGYACDAGRCVITGLSGGRSEEITSQGAILRDGAGHVIGTGVGVHQTALYDFLISMALVLFLVWLNRRLRRPGVLFFTYALWYGCGRILTDFLRIENRFFGLTGSQWTSLVAATLSVAMLVRFALQGREAAQAPAPSG